MRLLPSIDIRTYIICIFILCIFSSCLHAENSSYNKTTGITTQLTGNNLAIVIDPKKLLKSVPKLQKTGHLDPLLTKAEVNFYQPLLVTTLSIRYVVNIIKNMYMTQQNLDEIHVNADILTTDQYGNNAKSFCYAFDFDRKLYQKINWEKFQAENINEIAPHFKMSDTCQNLMGINPIF